MAGPAGAPGMDPWVVLPIERARYQQQFDALGPVGGVITGQQARGFFLQSQLPPQILGQIWGMADTDSDGRMNINEFSLACKLINMKLRGFELPGALPPALIHSVQAYARAAAVGIQQVQQPQMVPMQQPQTVPQPVPMPVQQPQPVPIAMPIQQPVQQVHPPPIPPPPTATEIAPIPRPVPSSNIPRIGPPPVPPPPAATALPATYQATDQHSTISTKPARPPPVRGEPTADVESGAAPPRPAPPDNIGAGFVPTTVPPPKPALPCAPPSYPASPVAASPVISQVPQVQMVQPMASADILDLVFSEVVPPIAPIASVAPIAPLNTAPAPTVAFSMGPTVPMQPMTTTGMVVSGMVPGAPIVSQAVPVPAVPAGPAPTVTPPMTPLPLNNVVMNGSIIHTPVSTSTPLSTTARPPSLDRVGSIESQHSVHSIHSQHPSQVTSPQAAPSLAIEWSVPHASKLKYTQLFNTSDRTRSGFLSGPQARNIMVQSQLPQLTLAQIWALSDMDQDGRLGCEEFVLAMHLCDMVKAGETLPTALTPDLVPPTFRRSRQSSITSQSAPEIADPLAGMPQSSFEDKRKENYEKGQAELDRRRKALQEVQQKEQQERERKEREEAEKQEKIRFEQERRRQAELEEHMQRQREIEEAKEEERKRAQEQKEAARKEMERQRQLEWETQKLQELTSTRQKEQDLVLKLKAKNQTLTIEHNGLIDKIKELSTKICDTRTGVTGVKDTIDNMRKTRDTQLQEMSALKNKIREQNAKLIEVTQEKAKIEARTRAQAGDEPGQEAAKLAFANKQLLLKQMRDKLTDMEQQVKDKQLDLENSNTQLKEVQAEMLNIIEDCKKMKMTFAEKRDKILEMRKSGDPSKFAAEAWGDDSAWGADSAADSWPADEPVAKEADTGAVKYRALYEFVARNQDEISFQPGDIIMVSPVQNAEPGWMAGEIRGHTGWFPESYVEPIDSGIVIIPRGDEFVHQESLEKRPLEEIVEVPENVSDAGSIVGEAPYVAPITPKLGAGQLCDVTATTLYQYRPTADQHLTFGKGEIVRVKEQQDEWCYGESSTGKLGWFPKSYVKISEDQNANAVSDEYYTSLYQYASNEPGDLDFNQGEVILVVKKEGDWWTGVIDNRTGIFPSNYVEKYIPTDQSATKVEKVEKSASEPAKIEPQPEKTAEQIEEERAEAEDRAELPDFAAMAAQQYTRKGRKPEIVQVIAPYKATSAEQLDLTKGQLIAIRKKTDSGWWEGELQARGKKRQIGWFPASYVKLLTSSRPGSSRSTPVSHKYSDSPTDIFQERVMALYPYKAQNEDELSFEKGDCISVISKDEESWWKGEMNGQTGVFPSNYVSPMYNDYGHEIYCTSSRLDPMERKRQEYIKELIVTEQTYIHDMQLVYEVFEKPLICSKILTDDEIDKIFINWRDIIVCNENFLRALRIRRDNSKGGIVRLIGDVICENIPRMHAYIRFCCCQISAAIYLQRLTETSPHFVEVVQRCQLDPRTKGMPLSSFLIKPMQRITKYPLIIGKILEYTRPDHPDRQYLQEALARAEEFCIQVNEGVREKENSDRLEWLQTHVNCDGLEEQLVFNSLTNSLGPRKLLHFGILHKAKSGKELVGFLTNDFLLFAQPTKTMPSGQQFSFERNEHHRFKLYRRPIFLQDLSILNIDSEMNGSVYSSFNGTETSFNSSENPRTLKLGDCKKSITLLAPSVSECTLWVRRITDARKRFVENERSRIQRQRSRQAQFKACGRVLLTVVEGISLKVTQGKCHPYCKVSMGSQEEQTIVVTGDDCPLWDTPMQFLIKDPYEDTLCITIFDKGYFSPDEFLGRAEVRVYDIMKDTQGYCGPITKKIRLREVSRGDVVLKLDVRLFGVN